MEVAKVSKEEKSDILGPFYGDYILTRTLLSDGKSEKVPTLNNKQQLTGNMANNVTTAIKGKTLQMLITKIQLRKIQIQIKRWSVIPILPRIHQAKKILI